jgi:hypothetical protein
MSAETKIAADGGANQIYDLSRQALAGNVNSSPGLDGHYVSSRRVQDERQDLTNLTFVHL